MISKIFLTKTSVLPTSKQKYHDAFISVITKVKHLILGKVWTRDDVNY